MKKQRVLICHFNQKQEKFEQKFSTEVLKDTFVKEKVLNSK